MIDAAKFVKGAGKSIGIYNVAKEIVRHVGAENLRRENEQEIIVLGNEASRDDFEVPGVKFIPVANGELGRLSSAKWELFEVKQWLRKLQAERVFFPRGYRPLVYSGDDVILVHDLIPFWYREHFPSALGKAGNTYITMRLKASIKNARRVVTISEYSRDEIERIVPCVAHRVSVIYNGVERPMLPTDLSISAVDKLRLPIGARYIAAMTSKLPHKNAVGIVRAYEQYWDTNGENALPLVVIGVPDIQSFVDQGDISLEAAKKVFCPGYISDDKLMHQLIAEAEVFLFLSLIEGFGLPPIEAVLSRVPVICSNSSCLPEVTLGSCELVEPDNPRQIAEKLAQVIADPDTYKGRAVMKRRAVMEKYAWSSLTRLWWNTLFR